MAGFPIPLFLSDIGWKRKEKSYTDVFEHHIWRGLLSNIVIGKVTLICDTVSDFYVHKLSEKLYSSFCSILLF